LQKLPQYIPSIGFTGSLHLSQIESSMTSLFDFKQRNERVRRFWRVNISHLDGSMIGFFFIVVETNNSEKKRRGKEEKREEKEEDKGKRGGKD
jgi:hypothetical protein